MSDHQVVFGDILKIVFDHINESPRTLAEMYIDRDRSLVYKWLNHTALPTKKLIPGIVRFICDNTNEPVRMHLRTDIDRYIIAVVVESDVRECLTGIQNFAKYLECVFIYALSSGKLSAKTEKPAALDEDPKTKHTSFRLSFALIAAVVGGLLWNVLNLLLHWPYFMGGSGNEPSGFSAVLWGMLTALPVAALVLVDVKKGVIGEILFLLSYVIASAVGGSLFYDTGFRSSVEALGLDRTLQEIMITFVFALSISVFPLISTLTRYHWKTVDLALPLYLLLPSTACVCMVLALALIHKSDMQMNQLRGFLIGFTLRMTMYLQAFHYLHQPPVIAVKEKQYD